MTYPQTVDLERELAPVVIREILAVYAEQRISLSYATRTVGTQWFYRALNEGFSFEVAQNARRYVHRVGEELKASYYHRRA